MMNRICNNFRYYAKHKTSPLYITKKNHIISQLDDTDDDLIEDQKEKVRQYYINWRLRYFQHMEWLMCMQNFLMQIKLG